MQHIIFGNYGNETIGLIEWAALKELDNVTVISVDTQWASMVWQERVNHGENLAWRKGFKIIRLSAKLGFAQLMQEQNNFPSPKYQWCAGFLKALPLIDWLDINDPQCEAVLLLGNRRGLAKGQATLSEFIEESQHFSERKIWHPLYQHTDQQLRELVERTGLAYLSHRSLECDPCVNNSFADFIRMEKSDASKTAVLEEALNKPMFAPEAFGDSKGIEQVIRWVEKNSKSATLQPVDMGCGSPFACGI
jgi:3'-phosphoadenosine 5'-phosphosulfate sulfotransferase (PAPS reductase)/FAD synthetase